MCSNNLSHWQRRRFDLTEIHWPCRKCFLSYQQGKILLYYIYIQIQTYMKTTLKYSRVSSRQFITSIYTAISSMSYTYENFQNTKFSQIWCHHIIIVGNLTSLTKIPDIIHWEGTDSNKMIWCLNNNDLMIWIKKWNMIPFLVWRSNCNMDNYWANK